MTLFWKALLIGNLVTVPGCFLLGGYFTKSPSITPHRIQTLQSNVRDFNKKAKNDDRISVGELPMPGASMLWLTPNDHEHGNKKLELVSSNERVDAKTVIELQRGCQLHKTISKVYLKKNKDELKFKVSKNSDKEYKYLSESTDFTDIKNFCTRPITNKEGYGNNFNASEDIKVLNGKLTCLYYRDIPYSPSNANTIKPCLKSNEN